MQKVEGSSPFSRLGKSPAQAGFFVARAGVVVVGLTPIVQWGRLNAGMIWVENRRTLCVVDSPP
jgi:hypothetical protein